MTVCEECGRQINTSGEFFFRDEDDRTICEDCAETYYHSCEECGAYINNDFHRVRCKRCCTTVYDREENSYSTKPDPIFKAKKYPSNNTGRYFGLEIELNNINPGVVYQIFNPQYKEKNIYNKRDGSISRGVEVVTNPMDIFSIKKLLNNMREGFNNVKIVGGDIKRNAGIHIHVNRKSVDPLTVYKLSYLLNYKSDDYTKKMLYYLSGRSYTATCKRTDYSYCYIGTVTKKTSLNLPSSRYIALNLTNFNTIEFRIFKSSTNVDTILMYIDLTNDMIEFCHTHGLKDINIYNFIDYEMGRPTTNKIIKRRIKNFQKYNGVCSKKENNYKIDMGLLKGVHYSRYEDIIRYLTYCGRVEDVNNLFTHAKNDTLYKFNGSTNDSIGYRWISDILENTVKKVLINKIKQELKKCA